MMYRCGWAQKSEQEVVLAIRLRREGFEQILGMAEYSSFQADVYRGRHEWEAAVRRSDVRLQWDPDHDPHGVHQERRAIQLGLRGPTLGQFADEWIITITDITQWVKEQYEHIRAHDLTSLWTPRERVYVPTTPGIAARLKLTLNEEAKERQ